MRDYLRTRIFTGLWQDPNFMKLWGSLTITSFGAQITMLALPLTAAMFLNADAWQMGLLVALETLPFAIVGLFAGVWVDRSKKLPLILWSDILRGVILLAIPVAAWLDGLSMAVLYAVGFLCGVFNVVGGAAYQVYMTQMVGRDRLVESNAKVAFSNSSAELVGPGLAGGFIQLVGAPFAILLDAISFFISGWMLKNIPPSPADEPQTDGSSGMWQEIKEGLQLVWNNPVLRSLAWTVAVWQLLYHMYLAVIILFATRDLGLSAGQVGIAYALSGVGCFAAALTAQAATRRWGVGQVIVGGLFATAVAWQTFAFIGGKGMPAMLLLGGVMLVFGYGATVFSINYLSMRQAITPDALLGRMTATMRFLTVAAAPLGSLVGGLMGSTVGLRGTLLVIGGAGLLLSLTIITTSPVRAVRQLPS